MKAKFLLSALLVCSASNYALAADGLGTRGRFNTIIGGTEVTATDDIAASTVMIAGFAPTGDYVCSGTIILDDIVVTAAHCVATTADKLRIVFARNVLGPDADLQPEQIRNVSAAIVHESYQDSGDGTATGADIGDIAILRISGTLPAGYHKAKIVDSPLRNNQETILAGYGLTDGHGKADDSTGVLRRVTTTILGALGKHEAVVDMSKGKGMCSGDSGGPAYVTDKDGKYMVWGVASRVGRGCENHGIHTLIPTYIDWLNAAIAKARATP